MCQYELTDFEWKVIEPLLPNQAARGSAGRRSAGLERHLLGSAHRRALAGAAQRIRPPHDLLQPLCAVARGRGLGSHFGCCDRSLRRRHSDDRQHVGARSSACGDLKKSHPDRCMGRSRGGLTTKIHALTDAQGLPLELVLSPGQPGTVPSPGSYWGISRRVPSSSPTRPTMPTGCVGRSKRRRCAQHSFSRASQMESLLQPGALQAAQPHRTLLQQDQTFPAHRHALRKARFKLSRHAQTGRSPSLDAP